MSNRYRVHNPRLEISLAVGSFLRGLRLAAT
jgi:hypothetical protein